VKYSAIIELTGKEEDEEEKKIIANHHQGLQVKYFDKK